MSQYSTPQETASVFRKATPNELWLHEHLDRINPERHEMGGASDTQALTILAFDLRDQRDESDGVRDILAKHLAGVAIALKGPELALHRHGYHDLEEKAQVAMLEIELLKYENQRLTGEAKVLRDLLTKARDVIEVVIKDGEMESDEGYQMAQLSDAMAKAVGMPLDVQFLPADDTEGGAL